MFMIKNMQIENHMFVNDIISYSFTHHAHTLPLDVSWDVVLDEVVEFVVIQESSSHIPAQFHVWGNRVKAFGWDLADIVQNMS